ncbi:MAG: carboxypeptidase-like regulatory domain-containing protein, partial [Candidatus Brocadia sp.]
NAGSAGKCKEKCKGGTGYVYGWVVDEDEESLAGVKVTVRGAGGQGSGVGDQDGGCWASTKTDEDGYYEFKELSEGDYVITYELEGYQTQTQSFSLAEGEEKEMEDVTMIREE